MHTSQRLVQDIDFDTVPTGPVLYLDSEKIEEDLEFIEKHNILGVGINQHYGFNQDNLSCLEKLEDLVGIDIAYPLKDISTLYKFKNLKRLSISIDVGYHIDLFNFPKLEYLNLTYNSTRIEGIQSLINLKYFSLYSYSENDLTLLKHLRNLKYLHFVNPKIKTLKGIENHQYLKVLDLNYCSHLNDISDAPKSLEKFFIYSALKLQDYKIPNNLTKLVYLSLVKTGNIYSVSPLKNATKLDIVDLYANIIDGDLSPLIGIRDVSFEDFPHFSHTNEEINAMSE